MAIRLKVCLGCGTLSGEEISQCPECDESEFRPFTASDLQEIRDNGNRIAAFFTRWPGPDSGNWQSVAAKDDLEK